MIESGGRGPLSSSAPFSDAVFLCAFDRETGPVSLCPSESPRGVCARRVGRAVAWLRRPVGGAPWSGAFQGSSCSPHPVLRLLPLGLPLHRLHDLRLPHSGQTLLHPGPDER